MFEVWFDGLPVMLTVSAERELTDLGLNSSEAVEVLQNGFDCSRSKRKAYKLERCLKRGDKLIRVVAAYSYHIFLKREVITIIHVSIEGTKWLKQE